MTNPDPKRVEAVARALHKDCLIGDPDKIERGRPAWQRYYEKEAEIAIAALDRYDAANGITRVRSLAAANMPRGGDHA